MYAVTCCNLRVGKFDVSASNMIIFWRQYFIKLRLMGQWKHIRRLQLMQANIAGTQLLKIVDAKEICSGHGIQA